MFNPGEPIEPQADELVVLLSGWAGLVRTLADRRRQIVVVLVPGNLAVPGGYFAAGDCATIALSQVKVASLRGAEVSGNLLPQIQRVAEGIGSYIVDHVVRLSILSTYERVGHFVLEVYDRLSRVGLTNAGEFLMPLSQERLGEVLGVSTAHVNRTFRQLREDGLLVTGPGWLRLVDLDGLAARVHYAPMAA